MSPEFPLSAGDYTHGAFIDGNLSIEIPTHDLTPEPAPPSGCFPVPIEESEEEEHAEEQSQQPEAIQHPPLRLCKRALDPVRDCSFLSTVKLRHYCALIIQSRWRQYSAEAAVTVKQRELANSRKSKFLVEKKGREVAAHDCVRALRKTRDVERVLKLDKDQ